MVRDLFVALDELPGQVQAEGYIPSRTDYAAGRDPGYAPGRTVYFDDDQAEGLRQLAAGTRSPAILPGRPLPSQRS